ncbi:aldehyde dehydrogenase family protein [Actinoplanes teichomyceticus]|uniref:Acyl-CoA reductase-like NAD-dependent aldehyde dehydrogenase n=1 Tax=Actinoplanes teichomyceticus TaxID=1867 RepID=A0A561WLR3_ACTTI|nr:aldehyde dehydrogenase [Actinoplanes teichomyceticus]TWG24783.1 acyl-CoA reductase-like NAD-dependent aldehyde dehydrogenase [Actinoplanes teichomyceticus]GIF14555.1 putative aldehyde dehydrogenase [Actinoplanes teichomyceticus]
MVRTAGRPEPLRSYGSYIADRDVDGAGWVYTVSARSLLEDVFTSVSLKRALENDPDGEALQHPYVVGRCAVAGPADLDASLDAAAEAAPRWAAMPLETRMSLGERFRAALHENRETFLELLIAEAHPRKLAEWELAGLLQIYSPESLSFAASQMHTEFRHGDRRLIVRRQADGVVCVNPPQNAPASSAALAVLALMAGNAVVVRAPRSIPLSTMWLMRDLVAPLLRELGAPPGTLNVVCSKPRETLDRWLRHPGVDDIFYFGGSAEGLRFQAECVEHGKKPILELAGNDGVVVWHDADLQLAAEAITECFFGSGQICMVPNYVIAHPLIADELLERVAKAAAEIRPGLPGEPDSLLSPVRRSEKFFALLEQARSRGAQLVCGGERIELDGTVSDTGVFLQPTVLRVDGLAGARDVDAVRHETFFPLLPVVVPEPAADAELLDRVIQYVNSNEYGLRNSLWAGSDEVVGRFVAEIRNGGLLKINDSHIGFLPYLPTHGGTGLTSGVYGEANYPIVKTSHQQGVSISTGSNPRQAVFGLG